MAEILNLLAEKTFSNNPNKKVFFVNLIVKYAKMSRADAGLLPAAELFDLGQTIGKFLHS